ncbi:MAG: biotin/lipoyl-containing protein, partial [Deferrisomatales bacterium]
MAYEFRFPDVGEGVVEGEIVEWKVRVGDPVAAHQTLAVVETDKAVVEIPSPVAGAVLELRGRPGDRIAVGEVLAVIGQAGAEAPAPAAAQEPRAPAPGAVPLPGGRPRVA